MRQIKSKDTILVLSISAFFINSWSRHPILAVFCPKGQNCPHYSHQYHVFVLFSGGFLNSCGCSTAKSKTPPQETFFYPLNGTEHGSKPSLTNRDRELVSVIEVRIEPGDLNPRPLTPQSVTLPTLPRAG